MAINFYFKLSSIFKRLASPKILPVIFGVVSGFLIFYFLYFFGAYEIQKGLSYSGHSHLFRSICFGVLTGSYLIVFENWIKPKLNIEKFGYFVLWYLGVVFFGSQLIFILFNFFWNWQEWNKQAYTLIIKEFPLMMLLPLSFYLVLKRNRTIKKLEESYISFESENGKDYLKIKPENFLYANSSENYIELWYNLNGQKMQHLIRKPLKVLEQELKKHPQIIKAHRSYLVNKPNIQSIKQIKGKVFLEFKDASVPVSKQNQHHFLV